MAAAPSSDLWMTAQEIAEACLPGLPGTKQGVNRLADREGWASRSGLIRKRAGRGGGLEYHASLLPPEARAALAERARAERLEDFSTLPASAQMEARLRLEAVERAEDWMRAGMSRSRAAQEAAVAAGVQPRTFWRWLSDAAGRTGEARLAALAPKIARASGAAGAAQLIGEAEAASKWDAVQRAAVAFATVPEEVKRVAEARRAALRVVEALASGGGLPMDRARADFCAGWFEGERFDMDPDLAEILGAGGPSAETLRRWGRLFAREGLGGLAPKWGQHRKGSGQIDQDAEMRKTVESMILAHPGGSLKTVLRLLKARFPDQEIPSRRTLEKWAAQWRKDHPDLEAFAKSPDDYKSGVRLIVGNASEDVSRLNQRWEMDSTPNDVLLSDGKRATLVACIDVWSRRVKIVVSRSSSSAAVAACLRKAILAWGAPEELVTDNGSDYRSAHVRQVCEALQIHQVFCEAYSPDQKPHVERFHGTFTRGLATLLEGFIGHNVAQRKAIESRKSFADRLRTKGVEPPELRMTAAELQAFCDRWADAIYGEDVHAGIGVPPNAKAQSWGGSVRRIEDERALDLLLMPAASDGGMRTVRKTGAHLDRHAYVAPELQRWVGRRVQLRLDEEDMGRVLALGEDGAFICWALNPDLAGLSHATAASIMRGAMDRVMRSHQEKIRESKKAVRTAMPEILADAVRRQEEREAKILPFPRSVEILSTPALETAAEALEQKPAPARRKLKAPEITEAQVLALATARPVESRRPETMHDRYLRWEGLDARLRAGEALSERERGFWRSFPATSEYAALRDQIKELGREAVPGLGASAPAAG